MCCRGGTFYNGPGDPNSVLLLKLHAFYSVSHLLAPTHSQFATFKSHYSRVLQFSNSQILGKDIAEVKESTKVGDKKKIAVFKKAIKKLRTRKQREYKAHFKGKRTSVGKVSPQVKETEREKDLRSE